MQDHEDRNAVRRFLRALDADLDRTELPPVASYLERFPEIADYVRETHAELSRGRAGEPDVVAERFEIRERIAAGAQGEVDRAFDRKLHREVALKRVRPGTLGEPLERFHREAMHASRVNHPAVCKIWDAGVADGQPWIAMELLHGETLAESLHHQRGDPPGPVAILSLVRRFAIAARGLAACHDQGVVHRDVKPSNLMLTRTGDGGESMTLFDFGVARGPDDRVDDRLTQIGAKIGTDAYMPPEQLCGRSDQVDGRSDVYSLGITAFEAVTGRCPVAPGSGSNPERSVARPDVLDPRRLNPHVSRDLCAILQRATEKDPARRYASAAELAQELEQLAAGRPIRARPAPSCKARSCARTMRARGSRALRNPTS